MAAEPKPNYAYLYKDKIEVICSAKSEPLEVVYTGTAGFVLRSILYNNPEKQMQTIRDYLESTLPRRPCTFGMFYDILNSLNLNTWHPQTLGFFNQTKKPNSEIVHFKPCKNPNNGLEAFAVSTPVDIVLLSLFHLIWHHLPVKICANCGRVFVPLLRGDAIYCDDPSPQDPEKTCKQYGSKVLWYENVTADNVTKLARNIYCAKQMLAKRHPNEPEYAKSFEYFKKERKAWEQKLKSGNVSKEEFKRWLLDIKSRKTM